ncbi:4-hydroxy-3-methylbut-2-enyl diphosphate reductase [Halodesulfovibrio sp.]|jgi:4-hydroxy-3-methylbut-2-enyl diphosphate reductase|uniref:4-hydroxy-3-methylbut-2-enyl diphosphate reductase n=1 Tax=Halodesulfovibrio sp. TaxID=1912772 RepID=UPI0025CCCE70|nr:4-hydroxy-3-methylbut-2-enyl diphosphate reductase [Halodesulfovibrio sp.]MCT4535321.1 4-hydroxy-3-methylbut-2-enyl diphosphate reductase [Halodesulfovibrio sp.]MCT4627011.1 4-hydroxy-3-methylbut-2-enyl diphosphate reductase [Halodesulfovibrio sp.]
MEVRRAKTSGFCFGVSLALEKLDAEVEKHDTPIATLGPIIHNPQVLKRYEDLNVRCLEHAEEAKSDERVVIRAHGVPRDTETTLTESCEEVVDATCPKVKRAQLGILNMINKGCFLLLYGEKDHPEVRGLMSYADDKAFLFNSLEELKKFPLSADIDYCLAAQTTQDREEFAQIDTYLQEQLHERLQVLNTICNATRERQQEAIALAKEVDAMVVVGGYSSGNTRRLADVSRAQGCPTFHVEQPEELSASDFAGMKVVGLTAGASTPRSIIDATEEFLNTL